MSLPVIHTEPSEKIVVYLSTSNLFGVLRAAYNSLLAYNPDVSVYLLTDVDEFPDKLPRQITNHNVANQDLFPSTGPNFTSRFTYMILLKAALTKIFPDAHKLLILDVDTIVNESIMPLWDIDLTDSYYAGVLETRATSAKGRPYVNFGVVMLNLDYLRLTGMDDAVIADLNTHLYPCPEQDAFAKLCGGRIVPLPNDYNDNTPTGYNFTGVPKRSIITHYAGIKSWNWFPKVQYWMYHDTKEEKQ